MGVARGRAFCFVEWSRHGMSERPRSLASQFFPRGGMATLTTEIPTPTVTRPVTSLAVVMLGFFVISLDIQIVNVTLPNIQ